MLKLVTFVICCWGLLMMVDMAAQGYIGMARFMAVCNAFNITFYLTTDRF